MISNGVTGYNTGNMNQPAGTILAMTVGPIKGRNWYSADDPLYQIKTITGPLAGAVTGTVLLQGTNDLIYASAAPSNNQVEGDITVPEGATWTTLATMNSVGTTNGTITVEYQFLQLIISVQGTGFIQYAWVRWN